MSLLSIKFNKDFQEGDTLTIVGNIFGSNNEYLFTWKKVRSQNYEIKVVETPVSLPDGLATQVEFSNAFRTDAANMFYDVLSSNAGVNIISTSPTTKFISVSTTAGAGAITYTINNDTSIPPFTVSQVSVGKSDNVLLRCIETKAIIQTSTQIDEYIYFGQNVITGSSSNSLTLALPRDTNFAITLINYIDGDNTKKQVIEYPTSINPVTINGSPSGIPHIPGSVFNVPSLSESDLGVNITNTITGATVTAISNAPDSLDLEYSLDSLTYQDSNTFTGQLNGAGNMFFKDRYGCLKRIEYEVNDIGSSNPIALISKANSIGFITEQNIDNINVFKNNYNSFDKDDFALNNYCDEILFTNKDKPKVQIKTNYSSINITLRKDNGFNQLLTATKRTNNLSRFQSLDGVVYKHSSGKLAIYFNSGKVYNENNIQSGTHNLNGNLPNFAKLGSIIEIDTLGAFIISDIILDRSIQKKAILIDSTYNGALKQLRIKSTYNVLPFEVWDFEINWQLYGNGLYDVTIEFTDPNYDDINMVSENINVSDEHFNTLHVLAYNNNSNNKDIFYKYDIKHIMRIPYLSYKGDVIDDSIIVIGDNSTNITKSNLNESDNIIFGQFPKSFMRRLSILLGLENLFINGIGYSKSGGLAIENDENVNIYSVEGTFVDNNIRYTNVDNLDLSIDSDVEDLLVPALLDLDNNNFLKL